METKFYYLRDKANRPLVTVCLAEDAYGDYFRGVAICSPKDNPVKRIGRGIALGRAIRGIRNKVHSDIVVRDEAYSVLRKVDGASVPHHYKSSPVSIMTQLEIKLLDNSKEKMKSNG